MTTKGQQSSRLAVALLGGPKLWPYSLLAVSMLFFSSNHIVARAVEGLVPPIGLSLWRWVVASLLLLPFTYKHLIQHRHTIRANLKVFAMLTFFLVIIGNTGIYIALNWTTAINAGIFATAQPALTFAVSWLLFRERTTWGQMLGLIIAVLGVLTVMLRGDFGVLMDFRVNIGDLWMGLAVTGFALYAVLLRLAPKGMPPLAVLNVLQFMGIVFLLPFYLWETVYIAPMQLDLVTAGAVLWTGILVALVAMALWNIGIGEVGANKASVFVYFRLILVTVLAVVLLGESVAPYHLAAFALVFTGIFLVTRAKTG